MAVMVGTTKSRWLKSARKSAHLRARPLTAFDRKGKGMLGAAAWCVFSRSWRAEMRRLRGEFAAAGHHAADTDG
ncbi:MAG: hypothetical protein ACLP8B_23805 [Xanthobacteraceae bacterium]